MQLTALDQLLQSAAASKIAPLRASQYTVRSWALPTEMLAAARLLVVPPQQLENAGCVPDLLIGRTLDSKTELRAAVLLRLQIEQQLYGYADSMAADRARLHKVKGAHRIALLMRVRRKEVLNDLIGALELREKCFEAAVTQQTAVAECRELVKELAPYCGHRKKLTGIGMMKSKKAKLAGRRFSRNQLEGKWKLRREKLRFGCKKTTEADCTKWTERIDDQLRSVRERVEAVCVGGVVHLPVDSFDNTTNQLKMCR